MAVDSHAGGLWMLLLSLVIRICKFYESVRMKCVTIVAAKLSIGQVKYIATVS